MACCFVSFFFFKGELEKSFVCVCVCLRRNMSKSVRCIHKNERKGYKTTVEPLHLYLKESFMKKKKIDELERNLKNRLCTKMVKFCMKICFKNVFRTPGSCILFRKEGWLNFSEIFFFLFIRFAQTQDIKP